MIAKVQNHRPTLSLDVEVLPIEDDGDYSRWVNNVNLDGMRESLTSPSEINRRHVFETEESLHLPNCRSVPFIENLINEADNSSNVRSAIRRKIFFNWRIILMEVTETLVEAVWQATVIGNSQHGLDDTGRRIRSPEYAWPRLHYPRRDRPGVTPSYKDPRHPVWSNCVSISPRHRQLGVLRKVNKVVHCLLDGVILEALRRSGIGVGLRLSVESMFKDDDSSAGGLGQRSLHSGVGQVEVAIYSACQHSQGISRSVRGTYR